MYMFQTPVMLFTGAWPPCAHSHNTSQRIYKLDTLLRSRVSQEECIALERCIQGYM